MALSESVGESVVVSVSVSESGVASVVVSLSVSVNLNLNMSVRAVSFGLLQLPSVMVKERRRRVSALWFWLPI